MSMNHKIDPLDEERSVIDNLIARSQNLMGSTTEDPVPQQRHTPLDYQMTASKSKMIMKSRRGRTSFTPGQLSDLETAFTNTHYPDFQTRKDLSNKLKIPDDRIQVWFQNRRAKWRKTQRQQNNGPAPMTSYRGHQMMRDASSIASQNQEQVANEIIVNYSTRPSPIRHTASLVKSETNFNTSSVSQTCTTNSKTQKQVQYQHQQQILGNGINIYEKNITAPHTSSDIVIPENQRTAPSLYSLSATVTSSGQYIILGPSNDLPTTFPMTMDYNNYSVAHIPSTSHNY